MQLQNISMFPQLWHNTWTAQTCTTYTGSMSDNMSIHSQGLLCIHEYKTCKGPVPLPAHNTISINNVDYTCSAIGCEWCKGWKTGDTYSTGFSIKWVLLPQFNPSFPLFLSLPSFTSISISVSIPPSVSLLYPAHKLHQSDSAWRNFTFCTANNSIQSLSALRLWHTLPQVIGHPQLQPALDTAQNETMVNNVQWSVVASCL